MMPMTRYARALRTLDYRIFLAALVVMLVHLTEDALIHKENGSSLAAQLGSTALTLLLVAVGAALYPVMWRRLRPVVVFAYGLLAFLGGWRAHFTHALDEGAAGGDYTGILYTLAGAVLIALAIWLAFDSLRSRPEPAAP